MLTVDKNDRSVVTSSNLSFQNKRLCVSNFSFICFSFIRIISVFRIPFTYSWLRYSCLYQIRFFFRITFVYMYPIRLIVYSIFFRIFVSEFSFICIKIFVNSFNCSNYQCFQLLINYIDPGKQIEREYSYFIYGIFFLCKWSKILCL